MKFGPVPIDAAAGIVLAHTTRTASGTLKKGKRLTQEDVAGLERAGLSEIVGARLEPGDIDEDTAAAKLADALAGSGVRMDPASTGRANLFAECAGILAVDPAMVTRFNRMDEGLTLATLPPMRAVKAGEMVATIKIIPFAIGGAVVDAAVEAVAAGERIEVRPYKPKRVGVVSTVLAQSSEKMLAKTARILSERLAAADAPVIEEVRVAHAVDSVALALRRLKQQGAQILLVYGASAIVDRGDVIPAGLEEAGGHIIHFGMPVDPGNLLLLGDLEGIPVVGAPGCARSPKENGFDWVLQRLLADVPVTPEDLTAMGPGGLLMEIESRPQPRQGVPERTEPHVAALLLAAGQSRRMGGPNKLLERIDGCPLVRIAAEAALASRAAPVVVVVGHQRAQVEEALAGLDVSFVFNPDYASGLASSLRAGIGSLPASADAAVICLADMPAVTPRIINRLIEAFDPPHLVALPTFKGKRGNPVLWARRFFPALMRIQGDVGARHLIGAHPEAVVEVEMSDPAVVLDVDTPDALDHLRGK